MLLKSLRRFALLLFLPHNHALAKTIYVAPSPAGNDANTCLQAQNQATPKATLQNAWDQCMAGGDTMQILAGTFSGTAGRLGGANLRNGTSSNPTTIRGAGTFRNAGTSPTPPLTNLNSGINLQNMAAQWIVIEDLQMSAQFTPSGAGGSNVTLQRVKVVGIGVNSAHCFNAHALSHHHKILNSEFVNCGGVAGDNAQTHAIYGDADDLLIEGNYIHDMHPLATGFGIQCYGSSDSSDRCIIRNNRIISKGAGGAGIIADGLDDVITGNVVAGWNGAGISCGFQKCNNAKIFNNTIYNNGGIGIQLGAFGGGVNAEIRNNIIFGHSYEIYNEPSPGTAVGTIKTHNACAAADQSTCNTAGGQTIAAIIDCTISTTDFRLNGGANPCVDKGANVAPYAAADLNGVSRPQNGVYDIGAYEFVSGTPVANAAPGRVRGLRWR